MVITKEKLYLTFFCICGIIAIIIFGRTSLKIQGVMAGKELNSSNSITYALVSDAETLDPALAEDMESAKVIVNIFEGLVKYVPGKNEIEPALATSWEVSQDGREWVFILREGVVFHDDTPFNAEAVKFSVERQMQQTSEKPMPYAKFVFGAVESIDIIDEYKVRFKLKYSYTPFIYNLAMPFSAPIVSPTVVKNASGESSDFNPVGTGPFQFVKRENNTIILKANPKYWGGSPKLEYIRFMAIPDSTQRVQLLASKEVDIVDGLTYQELEQLEGSHVLISTIRSDISYLGLFNNKKPFNDPKVRKAVSMAINRDKLANELFKGKVTVANGPLPPSVMGYSPELKPYPYNQELARKLLNEAGYRELEINLLTYTGSRPYNPIGGIRLARFIKEDLEKIGIKVNITALPWDKYKLAVYEQKGNAFLYGWIGDNGDPDNFLYSLFASSQIERGLNACKYTNSQVDFLLSAAQQEIDPKIRENMYYHAQQIIIQDAPWVFLNYGKEFAAISPNIKGFILQPNGFSYLSKVTKEIQKPSS